MYPIHIHRPHQRRTTSIDLNNDPTDRGGSGAAVQRCSQHQNRQKLTFQFIICHDNESPCNRHASCQTFSLPAPIHLMRTFQKRGIGGRCDSEFRHGYMPVVDSASAPAFRVSLLAKCPGSASHARHENRLKTPPQSQNPPQPH